MGGHKSFQSAAVHFQRKAIPIPRTITSISQGQCGVSVQRRIRNSPPYSANPQRSSRAWFAILFSFFTLLTATLSSTPFPVKAQWCEGPMALSTYAKFHAVLSAWKTPLIAFPLCPDKDGFCSHCFLEASMPEAGWLPLQSDPIESCDFSKVVLLDVSPLDELLEGRNWFTFILLAHWLRAWNLPGIVATLGTT